MTADPIDRPPVPSGHFLARLCITVVTIACAVVGVTYVVVIPLVTKAWLSVPVGLLLLAAAVLVWRAGDRYRRLKSR